MKDLLKILISLIVLVSITSNCARKGRPEGGKKDSLAPVMMTANPPQQTTGFSSKKIKLYFDEYINLKDISTQLVISPPLKYLPLISPQGTPSKQITLTLSDTLLENTTYTFNFGNSIEDNNEGNPLEQFKYIVSTGTYIDSLRTQGSVKDAYSNALVKNINVLLYRMDETVSDSIIFKEKPTYVANTLDSTLFELTNLKEGTYLAIALKEPSSDYLFDPREDAIGVYPRLITLPKDSVLSEPIALFREILPLKVKRPKELSKGHLIFGYEGDDTGLKVELLSKVPDTFKSIARFDREKDTIHYWHTPIEKDSLNFKVSAVNYQDTVTVFLRRKKLDSLKVSPLFGNELPLNDTLRLLTNNPLTAIDATKMSLMVQDSIPVSFKTLEKPKKNELLVIFNKSYKASYKFAVYPKALTDIFQTQNDSLQYRFKTKHPEDYGSITVTVEKKGPAPILLELLTEKEKVVDQHYLTENGTVEFNILKPQTYILRAIVDENQSKTWDTGNYLKKIAPEKVIYFKEKISLRANWIVNETFVIN